MIDIELRPVTPLDEKFLFNLYSSTRKEEMEAWGWEAKQTGAFLRMQFQAQNMGYQSQFPGAQYSIIIIYNVRAGRIVVWDVPAEIRLVDISLLQEFRGKGIGSYLIEDLKKLSIYRKKPLRLQVLQTNRAQNLYSRLGFKLTGQSGFYLEMEWNP
jgi:ribosomal protein S18 acetylase RimI-like enzyme